MHKGSKEKRAHFDHTSPRTCGDDGGCSTDIEQVITVSACANDVDDKVVFTILNGNLDCPAS